MLQTQVVEVYPHPVTYTQAAKEILKLTGPSTIALLIFTGSTFLSIKILSDLGEDQLAASGISMSVQNFFITPTVAMLESVCILIGTEKGKGNDAEIGKIYRQGMLLAVTVSVPLVIAAQFIGPILVGMGQPENLAEISQSFFNTLAYGIPFTFFQGVNEQAALGLKKPFVFAASTLCKLMFSTGLSYALIPGNFGFPALKEKGFGLALASGSIVSFIGTTIYFKCNKDFQSYQLFSFEFRNSLHQLKKLVRRGFPILTRSGLETASLSVLTIYVGWLGQEALAAQQVAAVYFFLFSMPTFVVNQIIVGLVAPQVSAISRAENREIQNLLKNNIQRYGNTATMLCLASASLGFILFATANQPLTSVFVNPDPQNESIFSLSEALFWVHGVELIPDSVRYVSIGVLKSFDDVDQPVLVTTLITSISLSLGYVLGFPVGLGAAGIYIARDIAIATGAAMLYRRLRNTHYNSNSFYNGSSLFPLTEIPAIRTLKEISPTAGAFLKLENAEQPPIPGKLSEATPLVNGKVESVGSSEEKAVKGSEIIQYPQGSGFWSKKQRLATEAITSSLDNQLDHNVSFARKRSSLPCVVS